MPDNIIINPTVNQITITEQVNSVIIRSPGPQGPAGVMIISQIPTISPIINTGSSIAFDQIAQYITLDARYAKITGSVQFSASSGSALYATNAGSATYSSSAGYATNSGSSVFSDTSASTLQTNFTTLSIAGSAVATQSYVNNASVLFAVLSSSAQYSSSAGYANLAGTSASLNGSPASSYALKTYVDSASLNAYNAASAFTLAQGYQTSTGSVSYAASAGTAINSDTTSQTNFNPLTISGSAVATQDYVNSQDFQKSTGSVAFATNSGSSSYATNSGNSLTTSQTSFNNINITASTQSTNTVNGALIVAGGIGTGDSVNIGGNLNVTGNIFMSGSAFTIGASNLEVIDSIILLSASNYYSDLLDIGFYGAYGSTGHDSASNHYYTGLVRDHLDGKWKLFSSGSETSPNTIDFNTATYDTLKLGAIEVSSSAQVNNLNAQYLAGIGSASYARLDQAQTFNGLQTIQTSSSANKGLIIRGTASQTANLQEWQNSSATVLASVNSVGVGSFAGLSVAGNSVFNFTTTFQNNSVIPLIAKNLGGTANIQEWQNSAGASLTAITNSGQILSTQRMTVGLSSISSLGNFVVGTGGSARVGQVIIGSASQTANLQEWQNSSGIAIATVSNVGGLTGQSFNTSLFYATLTEENSGGRLRLTKMTAAAANPLDNQAKTYFRDGTTASTLKQVIRAGASGVEEVLFDDIDQTGTDTLKLGPTVKINSIVGGHTITNASATNIPLTLIGSASQTANLQEWKNSSGSILAGVNASGFIYTGSARPLNASNATGGSAAHLSIATASSNPAIVIRPATATFDSATNCIEIFNTLTTTQPSLSINKSGQITTAGISSNSGLGGNATNNLAAFRSLLSSASTAAFLGRGAAGHTADLLQIQASTGSSLFSVTSSGRLVINIPNGTQFSAASAMINLQTSSSIIPGVIIRASASQTANLQEWQTASGAILASISGSGSLTVNGNINGLNLRANGGDTAGGLGIIALLNATTVPTANPTTGGIVFVEAGALKYRGTSGSAVTVAQANGFNIVQTPPTNSWIGNGPRGPNTGDQTNVNGDLHVSPFVIDSTRTLDAVAVLIGNSGTGSLGAVGRIGIWSANIDGVPTTLVRDCGTVDLTATAGTPAQISGLAQSLSPGLYWIGCVIQGAPATLPFMVTSGVISSPLTYSFQASASAAVATDFLGNNTYRSGGLTGTFASTPPTFSYNNNSVSPIKVIWRFSA